MARRLLLSLALIATLLAGFSGIFVGIKTTKAASYCQATYTVTNQWAGGFGGSIVVQNTSGSAWTSWDLAFTFPASGQAITQGWNATFAQSGQNVTVTNESYNSAVAANGSINPGFNGTWTSSNPVPTSFTVNGNSCNGSSPAPTPTPGKTPTSTPTPGKTPTPTPTSTPSTGSSLYVFSCFTSSSQSELYIYESTDGLNFHVLAGPANYTPPTGYLRDPSITRVGSLYYVAYTDNTSGHNNSTFGIASSSDLINWTFLTSVAMPSGTYKTWAPEWFKDPNGSINIIVNLNRTNSGDSNFMPYLITATNSSLTSWSTATPLAGVGPNYIDAFPVKVGNTYHLFTKNETTKYIEHATASSLAGPYTFVGTGNWAGWGQYLEGPAVYQLDNGTWRIIMDGYNSHTFWYSDSTNLTTWTAKQQLPDGLSGFVRHGTVLKVG